MPARNFLGEALAAARFLLTVEITTPQASQPFADAVRPILALAEAMRADGRIDAIALTDRSKSDHDHDPIAVGYRVAESGGKMPLIHWAGKDRGVPELEADLYRARSLGLENFLLVTGDKVRRPVPGRPVRYLDSVNALDIARRRASTFVLAGAVCPFKYREEDLLGQYLKAGKKLRAGADLLIIQIGWDMPKFEELRWFLDQKGYRIPLVAELLFLTAARSRRIRRVGLPGVTITDDLAQHLEREAATPDGGRAAAYKRLALQIIGIRHLGYQGAQVSGLHTYPEIARLLEEVEAWGKQCPTLDEWRRAWAETLTASDGRRVRVAPANGVYLASRPPASESIRAARGEYAKFKLMDYIDRVAFQEGSLGARVLGPLLRRLNGRAGLGGVLLRLERAIKEPALGCQACGFCRLPQTAFVCPETCPKGLANGPCGGTRDNQCEFGDRECIHSQIYRLAKATGALAGLEEVLIPLVPEAARDSCSWVTYFRGEGPRAISLRVPPSASAGPAVGRR